MKLISVTEPFLINQCLNSVDVSPAARHLQRSVIIIYLFRMLRGEGYGSL